MSRGDVLDRLTFALADRYTIEHELGARRKSINDGQGRTNDWRLEVGDRKFGRTVSFTNFQLPISTLKFYDRHPRPPQDCTRGPLHHRA